MLSNTHNHRMGATRSNGGGQQDPVQRARQKMGYKNNWHRGNVNENQVQFSQPLKDDSAVAIIGGGISGLACAQGLARHGMKAVVFDTGEHGVGGRAATRSTADGSIHHEWVSPKLQLARPNLVFDHAAQCFTATDPAFKQQVEAWAAAGVVQRWQGPVGVLKAGGLFEPFGPGVPVYAARQGMRHLAQHMADQAVESSSGAVWVKRPMWVSRMVAAQSAGGWQLTGNNQGQGTFGAVVIAHNGKCANRLVGPTGAPGVARQLMKLRLSAVWVLMVAFDGAVQVPGGMEGAFVQGSAVLSWVGNNTAKLQLSHPAPHSNLQCWTLISTNSYGQANKVPQEKIPPDVAAKVTNEMLDAFKAQLPAGTELPPALFTRVQLWGAALPLNTPQVPCILDAQARVGVCGDWLIGASLQSAVLSGWALADRLAGLTGVQGSAAAGLNVGLTEELKPLKEAEIGEFPGMPKEAVCGGGGAVAKGGVACGGNGGRGRQQQQQQQQQRRQQTPLQGQQRQQQQRRADGQQQQQRRGPVVVAGGAKIPKRSPVAKLYRLAQQLAQEASRRSSHNACTSSRQTSSTRKGLRSGSGVAGSYNTTCQPVSTTTSPNVTDKPYSAAGWAQDLESPNPGFSCRILYNSTDCSKDAVKAVRMLDDPCVWQMLELADADDACAGA